MSKKNLINGDMPLGLGMAFAQNLKAMQYFTSLSGDKRQDIIQQTRNINSKEEMSAFVNNLEKNVNKENQAKN